MSKLSAIYSALDNGNPKSAIKLCQQSLSKSSGTSHQLVKALLALAHARLGQSEASMEICTQLMKEGVTDGTVVDTLGYVFRREGRYDMYADLLLSTQPSDQSEESLKHFFITCVQARRYDQLAACALKLVKVSGEKKYFAWAGLGYRLNSSEEKSLILSTSMLTKGIDSLQSVPNSEGESRDTTSCRKYKNLIQYRDGLLSNQVIPGQGKLELGKESEYSEFFQNMLRFIEVSHHRSDFVVLASMGFSRLLRDDAGEMVLHAKKISEANQSNPTSVINLHKLIYGLDKDSLEFGTLVSLAMEYAQEENCLEECSPGKQLLLLSAVVLLEKGLDSIPHLISALSILAYGSSRFTHCSHFRLIECIVYSRLGLASRAVERFRALGIKNAQFQTLWWLLNGLVNRFFVSEKMSLLDSIDSYFKQHKRELLLAIETIIEEMNFSLLEKFLKEIDAAKSFVQGKSLESNAMSDYSPLLFMALPEIESGIPSRNGVSLDSLSGVVKKLVTPRFEESNEFHVFRCRFESAVKMVENDQLKEAREVLVNITFPEVIAKQPWWSPQQAPEYGIYQLIQSVIHSEEPNISGYFSDLASETDGFVFLAKCGGCLNGQLDDLISVISHIGSPYSKKSTERKTFKKMLSDIKTGILAVIESLRTIRTAFEDLQSVSIPSDMIEAYRDGTFVDRLEKDFQADLRSIKTEFEKLIGKCENRL